MLIAKPCKYPQLYTLFTAWPSDVPIISNIFFKHNNSETEESCALFVQIVFLYNNGMPASLGMIKKSPGLFTNCLIFFSPRHSFSFIHFLTLLTIKQPLAAAIPCGQQSTEEEKCTLEILKQIWPFEASPGFIFISQMCNYTKFSLGPGWSYS